MHKKGMQLKNLISVIIFLVFVIFLVLFTKNKGNLGLVWKDILSVFGL